MPGELWAHPFDGWEVNSSPSLRPYNVFSSLFVFLCCICELANQLPLVKEPLEDMSVEGAMKILSSVQGCDKHV